MRSPCRTRCMPSSGQHSAALLQSHRLTERFHAVRYSAEKPRSACTARVASSGSQETANSAIADVLRAVEGTERGVKTSPEKLKEIVAAVQVLEDIGRGQATTDGPIDATWELVWTTEKETLFILKNAGLFRTRAAGVYQVIDTAQRQLQNVITFANGASFVVDSKLQRESPQRLAFQFTDAKLNLPSRTWKLPPFGKGWFDTIYLDDEFRAAKDIRGDTLIVRRAGPPRNF